MMWSARSGCLLRRTRRRSCSAHSQWLRMTRHPADFLAHRLFWQTKAKFLELSVGTWRRCAPLAAGKLQGAYRWLASRFMLAKPGTLKRCSQFSGRFIVTFVCQTKRTPVMTDRLPRAAQPERFDRLGRVHVLVFHEPAPT